MYRELDVVTDIIREAGAIVLKHYEAGAGADVYKDGEPVTIADRESDAFIVGALRKAFPDDEIVSEESFGDLVQPGRQAAEPPSVEHAPPRVWYVDPMDGTSDFVKRTDDFVVMIGLAVAGWPVLGAVYHPPSGTLYRGGHGVVAEKIVGDER
ncbi:MAG: 3'(2'),5'-bisphosphate nucleotidase CysQ, partial [Acidobacteria bacterium]|nr:3'(2'),5'-bisphosphate nucleotidase CysQ [Acidobacteriota bacterium]